MMLKWKEGFRFVQRAVSRHAPGPLALVFLIGALGLVLLAESSARRRSSVPEAFDREGGRRVAGLTTSAAGQAVGGTGRGWGSSASAGSLAGGQQAPGAPAAAGPGAGRERGRGEAQDLVVALLTERTPVGAHARVPRPAAVRGIYLNAWAAGSPRKLSGLLELADRTEVNTFVIDMKEGGYVSYRSSVPLARAIGASRGYIPDIAGVLSRLRERGVYAIARIVVFKDPVLALRRPEWAIRRADGLVWRDHHGDLWVDPFNREVWDYNIALAREAIELGFSEVQWDYVRFPDVPKSYLATAVFPAQAGRTREQAIREFLHYSRQQLAELGAAVTADVFGLTVSARDDMGIGQRWELMVDATDVLLPMVYPSHFARGSYGIPYPNARPYETVRTAMEYALRRTPEGDSAAEIRPWLQDFTLGAPRYGPAEVRAQIEAVYDVGLEDWILWNPGSRYTAAALAPEGGEPPVFPRPGGRDAATPAARPETPPAAATPQRPADRLLGVPVDSVSGSRRDSLPPPALDSLSPSPSPSHR
ncbi:MAG: putative glycoside hydrolase [Gemmatimonadetes bacterium]|nr:putative glycoside hydrolase [Gemmatimonadota bacterium]